MGIYGLFPTAKSRLTYADLRGQWRRGGCSPVIRRGCGYPRRAGISRTTTTIASWVGRLGRSARRRPWRWGSRCTPGHNTWKADGLRVSTSAATTLNTWLGGQLAAIRGAGRYGRVSSMSRRRVASSPSIARFLPPAQLALGPATVQALPASVFTGVRSL